MGLGAVGWSLILALVLQQNVRLCLSQSVTTTQSPNVITTNTAIASFGSSGVEGSVKVSNGHIVVNLNFSKFDFETISSLGGKECLRGGLYFGVYETWDSTASTTDTVGPSACGASKTGRRWDPWLACSSLTSNPDCISYSYDTSSCVPAGTWNVNTDENEYVCSEVNYETNPFACEVGDWSGKYGKLIFDSSGLATSAHFSSPYEVDSFDLSGRSLVLRCGLSTSRAFCAPFEEYDETSDSADDTDDTDGVDGTDATDDTDGTSVALTRPYQNKTYSQIAWLGERSFFKLTYYHEYHISVDISELKRSGTCGSELFYKIYNAPEDETEVPDTSEGCDASYLGSFWDPTVTCNEESEYDESLCDGTQRCFDGSYTYICEEDGYYNNINRFLCGPADSSNKYGSIKLATGSTQVYNISGYDGLLPPLSLLSGKRVALQCSGNGAYIACGQFEDFKNDAGLGGTYVPGSEDESDSDTSKDKKSKSSSSNNVWGVSDVVAWVIIILLLCTIIPCVFAFLRHKKRKENEERNQNKRSRDAKNAHTHARDTPDDQGDGALAAAIVGPGGRRGRSHSRSRSISRPYDASSPNTPQDPHYTERDYYHEDSRHGRRERRDRDGNQYSFPGSSVNRQASQRNAMRRNPRPQDSHQGHHAVPSQSNGNLRISRFMNTVRSVSSVESKDSKDRERSKSRDARDSQRDLHRSRSRSRSQSHLSSQHSLTRSHSRSRSEKVDHSEHHRDSRAHRKQREQHRDAYHREQREQSQHSQHNREHSKRRDDREHSMKRRDDKYERENSRHSRMSHTRSRSAGHALVDREHSRSRRSHTGASVKNVYDSEFQDNTYEVELEPEPAHAIQKRRDMGHRRTGSDASAISIKYDPNEANLASAGAELDVFNVVVDGQHKKSYDAYEDMKSPRDERSRKSGQKRKKSKHGASATATAAVTATAATSANVPPQGKKHQMQYDMSISRSMEAIGFKAQTPASMYSPGSNRGTPTFNKRDNSVSRQGSGHGAYGSLALAAGGPMIVPSGPGALDEIASRTRAGSRTATNTTRSRDTSRSHSRNQSNAKDPRSAGATIASSPSSRRYKSVKFAGKAGAAGAEEAYYDAGVGSGPDPIDRANSGSRSPNVAENAYEADANENLNYVHGREAREARERRDRSRSRSRSRSGSNHSRSRSRSRSKSYGGDEISAAVDVVQQQKMRRNAKYGKVPGQKMKNNNNNQELRRSKTDRSEERDRGRRREAKREEFEAANEEEAVPMVRNGDKSKNKERNERSERNAQHLKVSNERDDVGSTSNVSSSAQGSASRQRMHFAGAAESQLK